MGNRIFGLGAICSFYLLGCMTWAAEPDTIYWGKRTRAAENLGNPLAIDGFGNTYSIGSNTSFLNKYDGWGRVDWTQPFPANQLQTAGDSLEARDLLADASGNVYVTGITRRRLTTSTYAPPSGYVAKYNAAGNLQWFTRLSSTVSNQIEKLTLDEAGNLALVGVVSGSISQTVTGSSDPFLAKINATSGAVNSFRQYGTLDIQFLDLTTDSTGNFYVSGLGGNATDQQIAVLSFTSAGDLSWSKQFGASNKEDYALAIARTADGSLYLGGTTATNFSAPILGATDAFLMRLDATGNTIWTRQFGTIDHDSISEIEIDRNGNVVTLGTNWGNVSVNRFTPDGTQLLQKTFIPGNLNWSSGLAVNDRDEIYISGYTYSDDFPVSGSINGDNFQFKYAVAPVPSNITPFAKLGQTQEQASGLAAGTNFSTLRKIAAANHPDNRLMIEGTLSGSGVTTSNDLGLWQIQNSALQLVVREGGFAPGTNGAVFQNIYWLDSTSNNQPLFNGILQIGVGDTTTANNSGIWYGSAANHRLLVRKGDAAPGTSSTFVDSYGVSINASEQFVLHGVLNQSSGNPENPNLIGIWKNTYGSLQLLALQGASAADTSSGELYEDFQLPRIHDNGNILFQGALRLGVGNVTEANNSALWSTNSSGELKLLAREGAAIPEAGGFTYGNLLTTVESSIPSASFKVSKTGNVAVHATVQKTADVAEYNEAIFLYTGDTQLKLLALTNQLPNPAAGIPQFTQFSVGSVNNAGTVVFQAFTTEAAGLWQGTSTGLQTVIDGAIPVSIKALDYQFQRSVELQQNEQSNVVFTAGFSQNSGVTNRNDSGLMLWKNSVLTSLFMEGDQAPGLGGAIFDDFTNTAVKVLLTEEDRVAFVGKLLPGNFGILASNDTALFAQDAVGQVQLILKEGDSFLVNSGDYRTINTITMLDRLGYDINNNYSMDLLLSFSDGTSGVFTQLVPIPEPSVYVLAFSLLVGVCYSATFRTRVTPS